MLDLNNPDLSFKTESEVEGFSKFFLSKSPIDAQLEFKSQEEIDDFNIRRERLLKVQLDNFRKIDFSKGNTQSVDGPYYKIVKASHNKPLSSTGAHKASSRFNFKENPFLKNRAIYFGKTRKCCEVELFHMEYQRELIRKEFSDEHEYEDDDLKFQKHLVRVYNISIDKILVLSTKPSLDAIGINKSAFMNEWYDLNEDYEIPSASQILGVLTRLHGLKGILYRSIRYQADSNLVLFEENTGELEFSEDENAKDYVPSEEILKKE